MFKPKRFNIESQSLFSTKIFIKIAPSVATVEAGLIFDFGASEKWPFSDRFGTKRTIAQRAQSGGMGGKALTNRDRWLRGAEQHTHHDAPRAWIR